MFGPKIRDLWARLVGPARGPDLVGPARGPDLVGPRIVGSSILFLKNDIAFVVMDAFAAAVLVVVVQ